MGFVAFYLLSLPPKEKLSKEFKERAVTKLLGRKAQLEEENVSQGSLTFDGKYISFDYPARALEYKYRDPGNIDNSSRLEDFIFDIKVPRLRFLMSVIENTSNFNSIIEYPAVRFREDRLNEYEKDSITVSGSSGYSYYKSGQESEKSGFVLSNGKIYSLIVTGSSDEDVEKLFDEIVFSAKLK